MSHLNKSTPEARKRSQDIDRMLRKESEELRDARKLLLLGTAEAGKSTILYSISNPLDKSLANILPNVVCRKQMKLIHMGGLSDYDQETWKNVVRLNTLQSMVAIAGAMVTLPVRLGNPDYKAHPTLPQPHLDAVLAIRQQHKDKLTASLITPEIETAIAALWADPGIQECYARRNEYQLLDSAAYFLADSARIFRPDYVPTNDDILRGRLPTLTVSETRLKMDNNPYRIYDVAGARADRHAWVPYFDDCQAIIFIVATSTYDQMLPEDTSVNRLFDAMGVFEQVANNAMLSKTPIILFLNKIDLLAEKLKVSPLEKLFPDYQPPQIEAGTSPSKAKTAAAEHACRFLARKFALLNRVKDKKVYMYNTSATDTNQIRLILSTLNRIILKLNLQAKSKRVKMDVDVAAAGHASDLDRFLDRAGPFTSAELFEPGEATKDFLRTQTKVLVIGAGGLGCELLKDLALSGFSDIHVIDMDTIDLSNLNRQFLFRRKDIGRPKAIVAAEFVNQRVAGVTVTPHFCKIQDKPVDFYMQFTLVITGLDSIEARRWINATLVGMVDDADPASMKPLIDGGTEGFKGQARVILPTMTACYECSLDMFTKQTQFPICTIANTPRLPEHCIEWASVLEWPKVFPGTIRNAAQSEPITRLTIDGDDPDHITWLYTQALKRANEFNITGVTYSLTQGVVKNIIPAIASTNAVISASCANEALKLVTNCQPTLANYMMYTGNEGVYTYTFELERKPDCPVCGSGKAKLTVPRNATVQEFMDLLKERPDLQLRSPSLRTSGGKSVYMQKPPPLELATRPNLEKKLADLVDVQANDIIVTDANLPLSVTITVTLQ
ncbi:NEDD8 activating enzyme [Sorochytrium milnesiophthora]